MFVCWAFATSQSMLVIANCKTVLAARPSNFKHACIFRSAMCALQHRRIAMHALQSAVHMPCMLLRSCMQSCTVLTASHPCTAHSSGRMHDRWPAVHADAMAHFSADQHHALLTPQHQRIASPSSFMKLQTPEMDAGCWWDHEGPSIGVADIFADPV